jgi:hypothetical protein
VRVDLAAPFGCLDEVGVRFGFTTRAGAMTAGRAVLVTSAACAALALSAVGTAACPESVLSFAPGSAGNLYGCQAISSDTATLGFLGAEASMSYKPGVTRFSPPLWVQRPNVAAGNEGLLNLRALLTYRLH